MGWECQTDAILSAIRTAIGESVTIGTHTLTWRSTPEGPLMRWLDEDADYPLIVLEPGDSVAPQSTELVEITVPVKVSVVIQVSKTGSGGVAPAQYKSCRLVGEAVLARLMDAGHNLGTTWLHRFPRKWGVDYQASQAYSDHGLLIYEITMDLKYHERDLG